jgi:hypothetical protein
MDILNNSAKYDTIYRRPVKFIILVTGESEYIPCNPSLIAAAKRKGYSIYAIQMNPQPNSLETPDSMLRHLINITRDVNKVILIPPVQVAITPNSDLPFQLENALSKALQLAITEPVATNVVIQDSFYNYIVPTDEASIEIMRLADSYKGFTGQHNNGTLTLPFPYDLPENNTTKVITYCNFVLRDLPISASNGSAPVVLASRGKDTASVIHYTWLKTLDMEKDLPAISMDLMSNVQLSVKGSPSTPPAATTKSPGLLSGLLTIISSLANSDIHKDDR